MKFLTQAQFTEMWKLQDSLNTATSGPDWKEKNQNWDVAVKSEIMEFLDYISWKWWKEPEKVKSPTDMQARLELVDIWHFLLSSIIENAATSTDWEREYERLSQLGDIPLIPVEGPTYWIQCLDIPMEYSSTSFEQKVYELSHVIQCCAWTWEELYKAYIGKVALNNFRQDHGYKEGTYQKIWQVVVVDTSCGGDTDESREDNYFLEQILQELSLTPGALTYEAVYHKLDIAYLVRQNN